MKQTPQLPAAEMFGDFQELPLFSGTPIDVVGEHFSPVAGATERQTELPGFEQDRSWEALGQQARGRVQARRSNPSQAHTRFTDLCEK